MKKIMILVIAILAILGCSLDFIKKRLPAPHKVKGGVLFQFEAASATLVTLAGNFPDNEWGGTASASSKYDSTIDPLYDDGTHGDEIAGDGIWSLVKPIKAGRYEYKYIIDRNTWVTDPNAVLSTDDGYGGKNSVLIVTD